MAVRLVFKTIRPLLKQKYPAETIDEDILIENLLYCKISPTRMNFNLWRLAFIQGLSRAAD